MLEKDGIKYYSMRDIAQILNHDRDWVKVRIEAFNLQGIKEKIKGVDSTLYDDSVIEYLKTHTYIKKKKGKGCVYKRNEDALSITEIAKRVGHDPDWVRFRLKYLNIQPTGTYFGHPAYSASIIEEIKKVTREDSYKEQHKPLTVEARKRQAESYKKHFWANKEKVLEKRYGSIEEKRNKYAENHIAFLDILEENEWFRGSVEKVCRNNNINIINYMTKAWIKKSDYPKLQALMKEFKSLPHAKSHKEKELVAFIESIYRGIINENTRRIITPKELDVYIPEKKVAIEFDGLFWHSTYINVRDKLQIKTLHLEKTIACEEKGIRLIHIFEDEWDNKPEICKSIIASALGVYKEKIYARNCYVASVSKEKAEQFLNKNHIEGFIDGIYLGLFYKNQLIQMIAYKKVWGRKTELYRMCTKLNTQVIGGFSKLLKHIEADSIVSYVDRRLFNGQGYFNTGWKIIDYSKPNYFYTKGTIRENRLKYQKHKLADILGIYDEKQSEEINMEANGYYRIYDCGTIKVQYNKA